MPSSGLSWKLCDLMGVTLAGGRLNDRLPGGRVDVGQNANATASVPLHFEDPAAGLAYPLYTVLKVKLDGVPLFSGILMKPRLDASSRTCTINAVGQGYRAEMFPVGSRSDGAGLTGAVAWNPWRWEDVGQRSMMDFLLAHMQPTAAEIAAGNPGTGIVAGDWIGDVEGGNIGRDRDVLPGTTIWQAWTDLSNIERGLDFQLTPLDQEDGTLCQLDTFYPQQGEDKTSTVILHFGWGKENASSFSYEPDGGPVMNRYTVFGQTIEGEPQQTARADQPESQQAFGTYAKSEGRTDVTETAVLGEIAQGAVMVTGWVQDFFEFTPAQEDGSGWGRDPVTRALVRIDGQFGHSPKFGPGDQHQAWLGDEIRVIARDGEALDGSFDGRITDLGFVEPDSSGAVVTEVKCTPVVSAVGVVVT